MTKRPIRVIPLVSDSEGQWKFGQVRKSDYISEGESSTNGTVPYVSVKRRSDGKYIVVEKYPRKLKPVSKLNSHNAPLAHMDYSSEVKFRSIKPEWKYSQRHRVLGDHDNSSLLPPIDLGWTSDSKIGSLDNIDHTPRGGDKQIVSHRLKWEAKAKIGSLDNIDFPQRTGRSLSDPTSSRKLEPLEKTPRKLRVRPRYGAIGDAGAFGNKHYTPGGAEVVRPSERYNHVKSKVGSLDNIEHQPMGGDVRIPSYPNNWQAESQLRSLENVHHKPGGGDVIFLQEKLQWNSGPKVGSLENINHIPGGGHKKIFNMKLNWQSGAKVGSLRNINHVPGGGMVNMPDHPLRWKSKAKVDNKPKKKKRVSELNLSFDSLDSYECEYLEIVTGRATL
ncbi:microtubule-associated protein tau-like [Haliotis asinina]|uniref:microtubule-associated protein tau-like n=1 Tax=Haliotis asinina TaxID=109174 RepID=UPI003531AE0C